MESSWRGKTKESKRKTKETRFHVGLLTLARGVPWSDMEEKEEGTQSTAEKLCVGGFRFYWKMHDISSKMIDL